MVAAKKPQNELERIASLRSYRILDTLEEKEYNQIVELASSICETEISLISLVDEDRQWFKAKIGIDADSTPRELAFCAHAILEPDEILLVEDAQDDPRFSDNPLVTQDPHIRFYAGVPLKTEKNIALGTLCVIDKKPHKLSDSQLAALKILAENLISILELRKAKAYQETLINNLNNKNNELEQFAYRVSHDIKSPLVTIKGLVKYIIQDIKSGNQEEGLKNLEIIKTQCVQLSELTSDILELCKVDHIDKEYKSINLFQFVENIISKYAIEIDQEIILINNLIPKDKLITMQITRLAQIVDNLISNAIKYIDKNKPEHIITINAKTHDSNCILTISDNGLGIPENKHNEVFSMFKRFHANNISGSGLGLAIVKKHIEKVGGAIEFTSSDKGTAFTIILPKINKNHTE